MLRMADYLFFSYSLRFLNVFVFDSVFHHLGGVCIICLFDFVPSKFRTSGTSNAWNAWNAFSYFVYRILGEMVVRSVVRLKPIFVGFGAEG